MEKLVRAFHLLNPPVLKEDLKRKISVKSKETQTENTEDCIPRTEICPLVQLSEQEDGIKEERNEITEHSNDITITRTEICPIVQLSEQEDEIKEERDEITSNNHEECKKIENLEISDSKTKVETIKADEKETIQINLNEHSENNFPPLSCPQRSRPKAPRRKKFQKDVKIQERRDSNDSGFGDHKDEYKWDYDPLTDEFQKIPLEKVNTIPLNLDKTVEEFISTWKTSFKK